MTSCSLKQLQFAVKSFSQPGEVAHAFNSSTPMAEAEGP